MNNILDGTLYIFRLRGRARMTDFGSDLGEVANCLKIRPISMKEKKKGGGQSHLFAEGFKISFCGQAIHKS